MAQLANNLSGLEKASVLMMSLNAAESAKVFGHLSRTERELLSAQIVKLRRVDSITKSQVLDEVSRLVSKPTKVNNSSEAAPISRNDEPMRWMEELDPQKISDVLQHERPQSVALVLANLSPRTAAEIPSSLPEKLRNQTALRLATMGAASKDALAAIDEVMRKKIFEKPVNREDSSRGSKTLAKILGNATDRVRTSVMGALTNSDSPIANQIESRVTSFEDMLLLTDDEVKLVLSFLDISDLSLALRVASDELKDVIMKNIHEDTGRIITKELNIQSQITLREIDIAQNNILEALRCLQDEGKIIIINPSAEAGK